MMQRDPHGSRRDGGDESRQDDSVVVGMGRHVSLPDAGRFINAVQSSQSQSIENVNFDSLQVPQDLSRYSLIDQEIYRAIAGKRFEFMTEHGCSAWLAGVKALGITKDEIPSIEKVSQRLEAISGWHLVGVAGPLPAHVTAKFLASKICPIVVGIREPDSESSPASPSFMYSRANSDFVREIITNPALLTNSDYANFLEQWGSAFVDAIEQQDEQLVNNLVKVFFFTIERGVIKEGGKLKVYGDYLIFGDALFQHEKEHQELTIERILAADMNTRSTITQDNFFVKSFSELLGLLH